MHSDLDESDASTIGRAHRSQQRPRRVVRRVEARRRRGDARASSRAPTSRAGSTPAIRRRCGRVRRGGRRTVWRSAPRCRIPTSSGSAGGTSTWSPTSCATRCSTSSARSTRSPRWPGSRVGVRQATRRALPRRRHRRGATPTRSWPPSSSTTRRWRSSACRGRRCSQAADRAGLEPVAEAFADRAYLPDGAPGAAARAGQRADRPGRHRRALGAPGHRRHGRRRSTARS